jgi:7-cyano-7-deazaguanine reductase
MEKDPRESGKEGFSQLGKDVRAFIGLETFARPENVREVRCTSDEVTALCPVTEQPDWYTVEICYEPKARCIESKSLKLYLHSFRNRGLFCEALASEILAEVVKALEPFRCEVSVEQKSRGGISIVATATWGTSSTGFAE